MMTINKNFVIICHEKILKKRNMTELEKALTTGLHGKKAIIPKNNNFCPSEYYLLKRYEINEWEPNL